MSSSGYWRDNKNIKKTTSFKPIEQKQEKEWSTSEQHKKTFRKSLKNTYDKVLG
jgi:hypothetical protein